MGITYRYDPESRTVYIDVAGEVPEAELVDAAHKVSSDPAIPPGHRELVDLRDLRSTNVTPAALRQVARIFAATDTRPEESRVAIVASADLAFGLSRMYEAYRDSSGLPLRVFRTLEEARAWLGLEAKIP
jgi:hypothetical protein